jgi:hypothetical protein
LPDPHVDLAQAAKKDFSRDRPIENPIWVRVKRVQDNVEPAREISHDVVVIIGRAMASIQNGRRAAHEHGVRH